MSERKGHPVFSCLPVPSTAKPQPTRQQTSCDPVQPSALRQDHKTGISIPLPLLWVLSFGPDTGRVGRTSGNPRPPPQPIPTHLPLGLIEDAVHGVEQGHALVEFEHLLLGQLQTEAQTDVGQLGPERRWARGLGVGGTRSGGGGLLREDPRWG